MLGTNVTDALVLKHLVISNRSFDIVFIVFAQSHTQILYL